MTSTMRSLNSIRRVWVVGAGHFGRRAINSMQQNWPHTELAIIDHNFSACSKYHGLISNILCGKGAELLAAIFENGLQDEWVVPAIPCHLAYQWIRNKLGKRYDFHEIDIPESIWKQLPNPLHGQGGALYYSLADFICPEACAAPVDFCTVTKKPRGKPLYERLESISQSGYLSIVIRSRQLGPGLGGYPATALFAAMKEAIISRQRILLSTACRCHAVMHAFKLTLK